ncbi:uncharacterized protein DMENIID0001_014320 [Sergentomyia squamirostris]
MGDYSDLLNLVFSMEIIIIFYEGVVSYLTINLFNKDAIMKALVYFDKLVKATESEISVFRRQILGKRLRITWLLSKTMIVLITIVGTSIVYFNLSHTGFSSPLMFTIPGIPRESIFFYPTNVIIQAILYYSAAPMIVVSDTSIMIIIIYFEGQLRAITEFMGLLNDEEVALERSSQIIRTVYEEHKEMLEKFEEIYMSLWHSYFHKFLAGLFFICFSIFTAQTVDDSITLNAMIIFTILCLMYILCYFSQILRNASDDMAEALYMTKWYVMQVKDQKNLLMLMIKFQYPLEVETFGFGIISINTFVQICKAGVSYATIVHTLFT